MTNAAACAADAEPAAAATALFLASGGASPPRSRSRSRRERRGRPSSPPRSRSSKAPPRRRSSEEASGDPSAAANARVPEKASATRRVRRNALRAFFAALGSPVASRVTKCAPRGGHGASLRGDANGDGRDGARRPRERFDLRRRRRRRGRVRGGGVRASAGGAPSPSARRRWCASSSPRRHKTRQNASKINARATPRSGRSRLAMYCLGELARLPPPRDARRRWATRASRLRSRRSRATRSRRRSEKKSGKRVARANAREAR